MGSQIELVKRTLGSIANKKIYKNWHVLVAEFAEQSTHDQSQPVWQKIVYPFVLLSAQGDKVRRIVLANSKLE